MKSISKISSGKKPKWVDASLKGGQVDDSLYTFNLHPGYAILLSLAFLFITTIASAQIHPIFIQLEDGLSGDLIKYYPGSKIRFSTKEYPKTWRKEKIAQILPLDSVIVFRGGDFIHINEVYKVRKSSKLGLGLGRALITFGQGWIGYSLYAGVAGLLGAPTGVALTVGGLVFGGASWGLGRLIQKVAKKKSYKMSEHTRLRIMDIRWTAPEVEKV